MKSKLGLISRTFFLICSFILIFLIISCKKNPKSFQPFGEKVVVTPLEPPKRDYWPTNGWKESGLEENGIDPKKFGRAIQYAFSITGKEKSRKGIRTDGLVVIKNGYLVYEKYTRGYTKNSVHLIWSITKSFINTLFGIAVHKKQISIDEPAYNYLEALNTVGYKTMTIRHLLNMSSGLTALEGYESIPFKSTVITMLYKYGRKDMGGYGASLKLRAKPGSYVYYSSCDSNILSKILRKKLGDDIYEEYPWKELFQPLGMNNVTWEKDLSGTFVASSYLYMTPRDLAKLGFLYLNDGVWNDTRILSKGWVDFTRTPAPGYITTPIYPEIQNNVYTAQWYTNTGVPERGFYPPLADVPKNAFWGSGHWGQRLVVFPDQDMVIVRTADDRDETFDMNHFFKLVLESLL